MWQKISRFYASYTTPWMPERFQFTEALAPLALAFFLAAGGTLPLYYKGHLLMGVLSTLTLFAILLTIHSAIMWWTSEPRGESRYISPTMQTVARDLILFCDIVIVGAVIVLTVRLVG